MNIQQSTAASSQAALQQTPGGGAAAAVTPRKVQGPPQLAGDNDGDGRKGAAALNDGDSAARIANAAIAKQAALAAGSVDVKA